MVWLCRVGSRPSLFLPANRWPAMLRINGKLYASRPFPTSIGEIGASSILSAHALDVSRGCRVTRRTFALTLLNGSSPVLAQGSMSGALWRFAALHLAILWEEVP